MTRELPREIRLRIAVYALELEPELTMIRASRRTGIGRDAISAAWRAKHGAVRYPFRPADSRAEAVIEPFAALCDALAEALTERPQSAGILFARFPEVNERRLWRALKRLIDTGRAVRHGALHQGAKYARGGV